MKYIYAVSCNDVISGDCYTTYENAKQFCIERSDKPIEITGFVFKSTEYTYRIHILYVIDT